MNKSEIREKTKEILTNVEDKSIFTCCLLELLQSLKDEKTTKNYKRLVLDTGKFYGVPKPALWVISAEIAFAARRTLGRQTLRSAMAQRRGRTSRGKSRHPHAR